MRLSRPRVLLRAAVLAIGGAFMLWKAYATGRAAGGEAGGDAQLLYGAALVEALVAVLALATSAIALLALRRKPRRHTLRLRGADRRP